MYRHSLDRLISIADRNQDYEICVVTQYEEIREHVENVRRQGAQICCVWSPESQKGISYSVQSGVKAAEDSDACVFFVADQPGMTEKSMEAFLAQMRVSWEFAMEESLGCVSCNGIPGNPVWFGRNYYEELRTLSGDQGGRKIFCRHQEKAQYYELSDSRELEDIDQKKEERI